MGNISLRVCELVVEVSGRQDVEQFDARFVALPVLLILKDIVEGGEFGSACLRICEQIVEVLVHKLPSSSCSDWKGRK